MPHPPTAALRLAAPLLAAVAAAAGPSPARAADAVDDTAAPIAIQVEPLPAPTAGDDARDPGTRLLVRWEVDPARVDAWVADRRLLWFELRPERGRRRVCRHPEAPRRVDEARILRAAPSSADCDGDACAPVTVHEEWIDVRAWCWGSALSSLARPGRLEVRYGFRRRGRDRWIARGPDGAPLARAVPGPTVVLAPEPPTPEPTVRLVPAEAAADATPADVEAAPADVPPVAPPPPVREPTSLALTLRPEDARRPGGLVFHVRLRSDDPALVYFRDDLLRFRVRGPLGQRTCAAPRLEVQPIAEFFHRLGGRRAVRTWVTASAYCPGDAFPLAGVYDVTPLVDLPYDGAELDRDAVVGTFEGPTVPVRIRRDPGGYVPHPPPAGRD